MVPEEMTRIPNNKAFWFLCQLLDAVRENLPEEFIFYAAGKTDLCHRRWDQNVEMYKQPQEYLGKELASQETSDHHKTLVFWLDELMTEHHLHSCWAHALDGWCLLDQLSDDDFQTYLFNVLWAISVTTAAWLRDASKERRQRKVRVICVCSAGKHRSVFLSRMLHHIYRIVFHLMRLRTRHDLQWIWAAEKRVLQEQKSTHGAGARQRTRQQPIVLHRTKALFFFNQPGLEHVVSLVQLYCKRLFPQQCILRGRHSKIFGGRSHQRRLSCGRLDF